MCSFCPQHVDTVHDVDFDLDLDIDVDVDEHVHADEYVIEKTYRCTCHNYCLCERGMSTNVDVIPSCCCPCWLIDNDAHYPNFRNQ